MNLKKIPHEDKKRILSIYLNTIGNCDNCGKCQACSYKYIIFNLRNKKFSITTKTGVVKEMPSFENMESFGYTLLQTPLESLIISYPVPGLKTILDELPEEHFSENLAESFSESSSSSDNDDNMDIKAVIPSKLPSKLVIENTSSSSEEVSNADLGGAKTTTSSSAKEKSRLFSIDPHQLTGRIGLERMMNFVDEKSPPQKGDFEYKKSTLDQYGKIFSRELIGSYSSKIKSVLDNIFNKRVCDGILLIYSQYIDSGLIPMALALEEMGFTRYGQNVKPLFKNKPTDVVDVRTMMAPKNKTDFLPARYAMITGDPRLSPNNDFEVKGLTSDDNKDGNKIKVVLISKAGSE